MSLTPKQTRKQTRNLKKEVNSLKFCDFIFKEDIQIIQWEKINRKIQKTPKTLYVLRAVLCL